MENSLKIPIYIKAVLILIGIIAFVYVLYITQAILLPLIFAIIFAIVLHPIVRFLVKHRIKRVLAIVITLTLSILVIAAIGGFMVLQISRLGDSWPTLIEKFSALLNQVIIWFVDKFDISLSKVTVWIAETRGELLNINSAVISETLLSVGSGLVIILLIPVYVFLILLYQPQLLEFFSKILGAGNRVEVSEVINQIKNVVQRYLVGLSIEALIVATLNSVALLILGIDYAILLGVIGALLNLIPYIGGIVGVALPMTIALITKSSPMFALYILVIYYFIQLIDNYIIVPRIVASKVKLNALVTIVVVIAFGFLWGIPGMFLSIPLTAIIKVILDHIESLKPWGNLLGQIVTTKPKSPYLKIKNKIFDKSRKSKS